ncbi:hypothetical protein ACIA8F_14005 [Streptomyces sp. NPDC051563]|uniref:hypothetical protein n=1 Tax=Streptomyces sp. NPDC051563 TaxID=3365659 RepID=UPI0037A8F7F1
MTSALLALALLAAVAGPILLRLLRHPGFVTGRDGRLSTSTTLALAWTVILLWLLLATLGYGLTAGGGVAWFQGPEGPLSSLTTVYLPLLGGPYAALIAAKAVVGMRVERGSMAKPAPKGTERRPLHDLIANDSGRTDLVDLQYVALSAVTMLYVVAFFVTDVGAGLPKLPSEMWALTGAPAGAYLLNKMAVRANPVITRVSVTEGLLAVEGGGFGDAPLVEVDGTALPTAVTPAGTLAAALPATAPPAFSVVVTTRGLRSDPSPYPAQPSQAGGPVPLSGP